MEDIDQKISLGNVFLQAQAVTTISENISSKFKDIDSIYESPEVKKLWEMANGGTMASSVVAVETLVGLVRKGCLPAPATMQNFLADISSAKYPAAIVQGITQILLLICEAHTSDKENGDAQALLCPFTGPPKGTTHPYVLLITRRPEMTKAVVEEVNFLLHHPDSRVRNAWVDLVHPLMFHSFCLTEVSPPSAVPLLSLLISNHSLLGKPLTMLLCKVAVFIKHHSTDHLERKVSVLIALSRIAVESSNPRLMSALLPCLVISLSTSIKSGLSTRTLECFITMIASQLSQGCDVTICALAEALPLTSGALQVSLLRIGATLLSHKDGNPLVAGRLLPSLLQALSAPCTAIAGLTPAAASLVSLIQATPSQVSTNAQLAGNEYWDILSLVYPDLATYVPAVDLCNQIVKDPNCATEWLAKLASTVHQISKFHYTIVTAVFLYQGSSSQSVQEAGKVLEREVEKCKNLSIELFPIVLYRLGREPDPPTKLKLLYLLPSLAVDKLCVAMVLKTLLSLWSSPPLKPLILRLLLEVWKIEPRVYSYLSKLILDRSSTTPELEISRAFVVSAICKAKPSQHGEELLSVLSSFLNEYRGKDGTAQTMLALDGIYELCSASVIDLRTAWKVIAPKLVRDKRPEVIVKLCELLSLAPKLAIESKEYDEFISSVVTILWTWFGSKIKTSVNEAALKALENFDPLTFRLKMLPSYAREGHKLPDKFAATPYEAARKAEDVLNYVPGMAWIKLVTGCQKSHLKYVESFVKALVEREVSGLPKGIYMTAIQEAKKRGCKSIGGQPEPPNYNFLADTSILRASVHFLQDFSKLLTERLSDADESEKLINAVNVILIALGQPLKRPFPSLDWSFLNEVKGAIQKWDSISSGRNWATRIRHGIFRVTAQQCNKSSSALSILGKWLEPSEDNPLTNQDELNIIGLLDQLGRGLNPQTLQQFLSFVFSQNLGNIQHLEQILIGVKPHLTCDYIHDNNRNVISNAIESLNEKINPTNDQLYNAYKACVADLPQKHIERLTSPSLWWEITDEKVYRAAVLRCHVAANDPEKNALPWLNDLVDSTASLPGDRSHFLLVMSDTLVARSETEESSTWLLTLLGRLREHIKRQAGDNLVLIHEQQQRVTFYMDLLVLGLLIWSGMWATCAMSKLCDSHIVRNSLLTAGLVSLSGRPDWKKALPQLLNWLMLSSANLLPFIGERYELKSSLLLLASLSPKLSQAIWNKIVTMTA